MCGLLKIKFIFVKYSHTRSTTSIKNHNDNHGKTHFTYLCMTFFHGKFKLNKYGSQYEAGIHEKRFESVINEDLLDTSITTIF